MPVNRLASLLLLCVLPLLVNTAQAQEVLPDPLRIVINGHSLPTGSYGLMVQEVGASGPLLAINSDASLNPASSMKTLTTLAALELLGPAWTWKTEVYALGTVAGGTLEGDLLIRGGGDPYLLEDQFRNLLKAMPHCLPPRSLPRP
jgi:D-alanyl-D-alanine carboxypeptidase/D-alanyl-D-alanine-endopeptidase (penicillin-binding protein 4)